MKVKDAMSKQVDFVTPKTSVKDVSHLIFGRGINGVPVLKGRKVVGFITEKDILAQFYPSLQEYVEDPIHMGNFEEMEGEAQEVFNLTADKIMSWDVTTISPNTPLLRAHSLMILKKIGRLPVVDSENNLLGIISKGDIFRATVGDKLELEEDEEYNDWLSKRYYLTVDWKNRLSFEIPDLVKVFRKNKVQKILDVGCGTGEHSIELAKKRFVVFGIDRSKLMIDKAEKGAEKLSKTVKDKIKFLQGEYEDVLENFSGEKFDAAIFMGNTISHNPYNFDDVIKKTANVLSQKGIMIFQITNFENVFKVQKRLLNASFIESEYPSSPYKEHLFIEFYDPSRDGGKTVLKTFAIFDFDGKKWKFYGLRNALFAYATKDKITKALSSAGFKYISFYGSFLEGNKWDYLFRKPFVPLKSDWLNVVAKR